MGISELIERTPVIEILHAVHNPIVTFGCLRSARTDPRLDPQRQLCLFTAIPGLLHNVFHAWCDTGTVINGE
jgi:hypothetical protein